MFYLKMKMETIWKLIVIIIIMVIIIIVVIIIIIIIIVSPRPGNTGLMSSRG